MIDRFRLYAKGGGGGSGCSSSRRSLHDHEGVPDGGFSIILVFTFFSLMCSILYFTIIQAVSRVLCLYLEIVRLPALFRSCI